MVQVLLGVSIQGGFDTEHEALRIVESVESTSGQVQNALWLGSIANVQTIQGKYGEAKDNFYEALQEVENVGEKYLQCNLICDMANHPMI